MSSDDIDVCVIGSSNLDLVARAARIPSPGETVLGYDYFEAAGGKGLNQAVAAARAGATTAFVSMLGQDNAADQLAAIMATEGLHTEAVGRWDGPTGRALINVGDDGENSIVVVPGANARLLATSVQIYGPMIARASVVLAQLEVPMATIIAAFEVARAVGATTILNPAPAQTLPSELYALTDILVPNEHEEALLGGASLLRRRMAGTVIVTEGERGARMVTAGGEVRVPTYAVEPVDTTAAGDSFCGALAARIAQGADVLTALKWACAAGALATTKVGAVPSIPHRSEIEALVASQATRPISP
jgi:ribokinase